MQAKMKLSIPQKADAEITISATMGHFMAFLKSLDKLREEASQEYLPWPISSVNNIIYDVVQAATKETHIYYEAQQPRDTNTND